MDAFWKGFEKQAANRVRQFVGLLFGKGKRGPKPRFKSIVNKKITFRKFTNGGQ